jgi:hypothetical protein
MGKAPDRSIDRTTQEPAMTQTTHPSKEQVRILMAKHREERTPPLSPEEFRRQLGWEMLKDEREAQQPR